MKLRRKLEKILCEWKLEKQHKPLIIKGARQIGKTFSILEFAKNNYENVIYINFAMQPQFLDIFNDGYDVDTIIKNISSKNTELKIVPNKTLIFFDELQNNINCATSLKSFCIDKRYDVICSGSMMGINYHQIHSNSVGYKQDYEMFSLDFEEFLWAKGYSEETIDDMLKKMINLKPFTQSEYTAFDNCFKEYMAIGGLPEIVANFIKNKNYCQIPQLQEQIVLDYKEDISKYAQGLDKSRILDIYNNIHIFLGQDNKKFRVSKIAKGKGNREYISAVEWLNTAGIVNICYQIEHFGLPLKGNYNPKSYKVYFKDTGLLIGSLDQESRYDLLANRNFNTYKGAIYENIIADILAKQKYDLFYYKNEKSTIEIDFVVRDISSIVPIEVKARDNKCLSLRKVIEDKSIEDIKYGIKFCNKNIGFNDKFYTFPYFTTFLLRRYLEKNKYHLTAIKNMLKK